MIKRFQQRFVIALFISTLITRLPAADGKVNSPRRSWFRKPTETTSLVDRKSGIMDGNLILTLFYNFGGIGNWSIAGRLNSGIYPKGSGRSYFAEFTPIIGAEVYNADGLPVHIFSDGIVVDSRNQMDKDENGRQLGFDPIAGYANPLQDKIAMSDDPDSWPTSWPGKDNSWDGYWNGQYGKYVRGDLETYFVMDDYGNDEFSFYPASHSDYRRLIGNITVVDAGNKTLILTADNYIFDPSKIKTYGKEDVLKVYNGSKEINADFYSIEGVGNLNDNGLSNTLLLKGIFATSQISAQAGVEYSIMKANKRGLAFQVDVRGYQWAHPAAEDLIIWTYWINNTGDVDYEKTVFAMYGDADVGDDGDQHDDDAWFDRPNSIVYQWDHDMWSNVKGGFKPAYFGWRFLESPGNPMDGIDNDFDGMVDESQADGIDNDGDWDPDLDDKGSDGIGPSDEDYPGPDWDGTEANGVPDPGEPNFEYTDNDESDQIGLTSFAAEAWPGIMCSNDEGVWNQTRPDYFGSIQQNVDLTFLYGSGYFTLPSVLNDSLNSRRKFSVAMVLGEDEKDIFRNADVIQRIYNSDYAFAKPPRKPNVTVVPGDHKVTLYWDKVAEGSIDHIYGKDFEGYRIYRATDPNFMETQLISDAYGNLTFNKPMAQFDIDNGLTGLHPVDYNGVKFEMGDDTGLYYSLVDSTVQNGQTYYYAVCSYDKGYYENFYKNGWVDKESLPPMQPSECSKRLFTDVSGNVVATDVNTVVVIPNAPAAGYVPPIISSIDSSQFIGTGNVNIDLVDELLVPDNTTFEIHFKDTETDGLDNDSDWIGWNDEPDGVWNEGERFRDYGLDKIPDSLETGYNPIFNPDPAHDNYNKFTNHIDRFDNDGDGMIDSLDVKIITTTITIIDTTSTPPDTTIITQIDTVFDDWGTENNGSIDWYDVNSDGIYQTSEDGETFSDVGNGVRDPGESLLHDLGLDGIADTGDEGEGDGIPTPGIPGDPDKPGEPNVDIRDNEERERMTTVYSLIDVTYPDDPETLIVNSPWINGEVYNAFTHGMHIRVTTSPIEVMAEASRWANPRNLFTHSTKKYEEGIKGIKRPHDYQIIITDSVQFESYNRKPANFWVKDITTGDSSQFVYFAKTKTGKLSHGDKVLPIIDNYDINTNGSIKGTWIMEMKSKLPNIKQIFKDSQQHLWAVSNSTQGCLAYYYDMLWVQVENDALVNVSVNCIVEYVNNKLWIGTSEGILTFDGLQFEESPIDTFASGDIDVKSLLVAGDGSVWIGTNSGLTHYLGPNNYQFYTTQDSEFASYDIRSLFESQDGSIWVGTANGIVRFNGTDRSYIPSDKLPNKTVNTFYENSLGVLVATEGGIGILPPDDTSWVSIPSGLLASGKVRCFAEYQDSLWIGTEKGISIFKITDGIPLDDTNIRDVKLSSGLIRSENIYSLLLDGTVLWIGNHQGFDTYNGLEWDTFAPKPGDVFTLKISKPYNSDDIFTFTTTGVSIDKNKAKDDLKRVAVVPNPYIVAASWEPKHLYTSGRGERKIDFIHLPHECTIKIFTLRGYLVQTIKHQTTLDDGSESWDLTSKDGLDVAYGLYLYHVDAPGIGTKIGKFAVIK